ncbi:MAG: hypothetical protein AVDCRST_MAG41-4446, partial [uncultured Corynebacteriales bacterium]
GSPGGRRPAGLGTADRRGAAAQRAAAAGAACGGPAAGRRGRVRAAGSGRAGWARRAR